MENAYWNYKNILKAICSLLLFAVVSECNYGWYAAERINGRCGHIKRELILDAHQKVQAFKFIKRTYEKNYQFTIGETYYNVKNRYNRIMSLYADMEKVPNITYQIWRTQVLVEILRLSMDANQMTLVMEEGDTMMMKRKQKHEEFMKKSARSGDFSGTAGWDVKAANKSALRAHMKSRGFARRSGGGLPKALPPVVRRGKAAYGLSARRNAYQNSAIRMLGENKTNMERLYAYSNQ